MNLLCSPDDWRYCGPAGAKLCFAFLSSHLFGLGLVFFFWEGRGRVVENLELLMRFRHQRNFVAEACSERIWLWRWKLETGSEKEGLSQGLGGRVTA